MAKRLKRGQASESIREYLKDDPTAKPTVVVEALAAKGIRVKASLVGLIKYKIKNPDKKAPGKKRGGRRRAKVGAGAGGLSAVDLFAAKQFVDGLGGLAQAREALETLEQLR